MDKDEASNTELFLRAVNALNDLTRAITPLEYLPGKDDNGGAVSSLTEAVMSVAASLNEVAIAIEYVGDVLEAKQ